MSECVHIGQTNVCRVCGLVLDTDSLVEENVTAARDSRNVIRGAVGWLVGMDSLRLVSGTAIPGRGVTSDDKRTRVARRGIHFISTCSHWFGLESRAPVLDQAIGTWTSLVMQSDFDRFAKFHRRLCCLILRLATVNTRITPLTVYDIQFQVGSRLAVSQQILSRHPIARPDTVDAVRCYVRHFCDCLHLAEERREAANRLCEGFVFEFGARRDGFPRMSRRTHRFPETFAFALLLGAGVDWVDIQRTLLCPSEGMLRSVYSVISVQPPRSDRSAAKSSYEARADGFFEI